ncbi:MAG: lytic transglycosylase domain-containing protein [Trichlorobacter sp.]|nr:lytic transglycosylase domain-containing protein [Trichlorobacter sp.]
MAINPAQLLLATQQLLSTEAKANPVAAGVQPLQSRFANRLDKSRETGRQETRKADPEELKKIAEALHLSSLRSSIEVLLGSNTESAPELPLFSQSLPKLTTMLQSYLDNLPVESDNSAKQPARQMLAEPELMQGLKPQQTGIPKEQNRQLANLDQLIEKASKQHGVDAELIRAVIRAESSFNHRAVSHAGAQGLMQLMPATAKDLGVTDPFNPEENIMAGTRFLKSLLKRYNGNLDSALSAYNWGPGNVDRKPDQLPRETRDYLVKVKKFYNEYKA